ncbi:hypothetical protein Tco_1227083 [Tanacetum coccineum]
MELTLEQTQQGVSHEVSNIRVISFTMKMEILLEPTSNKLMVGDLYDSIRIKLVTTGKKRWCDSIRIKLVPGTPDDCDKVLKSKQFQRSFRHSDTKRLSRSDEVLKLKNFKKDATLKLFKSTNQERYEHVGPEVTSSQDGKSVKDMERKCVTSSEFWKVHKKVNQVLHEIVPQLAERAIKDLIENNLKPCIDETIIEDHDAFRSEVPDLISKEIDSHAPQIIEELFNNYVQNNVIQVHPTTTTST